MAAGKNAVARRAIIDGGGARVLDVVHARHDIAAPDGRTEIDDELDEAARVYGKRCAEAACSGRLPRRKG